MATRRTSTGQSGEASARPASARPGCRAAPLSDAPLSCPPLKSMRRPSSPDPAFTWSPAHRPPATAAATASARGSLRLAAAAQLARRCMQLGVQPPLAQQQQQQQPPPPTQPHLPPAPDRIDALAAQVQQHSSTLAAAVQGTTQQLAAQQRMLQDVVQGLLFVGAKAAGNASPPPRRQGVGSAGGTPASHVHTAAPQLATRPPRPRPGTAAELPAKRRALLAQGLAAEARQQLPPHEGKEAGQGQRASTPALQGMLHVPLLRTPGSLRGVGQRGADAVHPQLSLECQPAAADSPPAGTAQQGQPRRPAWDDRFSAAATQARGGRANAAEAAPPLALPGRQPGGLAPQLLLQELQRLQRRKQGSAGGRARARRSLHAPQQHVNAAQDAPFGGVGVGRPAGGSHLLQSAKAAAATTTIPRRAAVPQEEGRTELDPPAVAAAVQ